MVDEAIETLPEPKGNGVDGERDGRGRFTKGNSGGPGSPYNRRVAELRSALLDAVTPKDVAAMVAAMIGKAKDGDSVAFRVIAPYLFGKPSEATEIEEDGGKVCEIIVTYADRSDGTSMDDDV